MRLLDRYLLRELAMPLGACLGLFFVFWVAFDLLSRLEDFQKYHLTAGDILAWYWWGLPELLLTVLPVGLLLALLYALTNHARHHELTAIRAAGVGTWRMCLPYLAVGLGLSALLFVLNEDLAADGRDRQEAIMGRRMEARGGGQRNRREGVSFDNATDRRQWSIGAFNLATQELELPSVRMPLRDGARRILAAASARWTNGSWRLTGVEETIFRGADDPLPVTRPTGPLRFPKLPGGPEAVAYWPGEPWKFFHPVTRTNVTWRTNIVVPTGADGVVWRIGAWDPAGLELHGLSARVPLDRDAQRVVMAAGGVWREGGWVFTNAVEFIHRTATDDEAVRVPLAGSTPSLPVPELTETPEMLKSEIRINSLDLSRAMKRPQLTIREILDYYHLHPQPDPRKAAWLDTQFHARLAAPWTCLVVVLIAVPFGMPSGRRNVFYGVAGSIGLAFGYFVLQRTGFALGQSGRVTPWLAAWLPNLFFAGVGIVLTARVR